MNSLRVNQAVEAEFELGDSVAEALQVGLGTESVLNNPPSGGVEWGFVNVNEIGECVEIREIKEGRCGRWVEEEIKSEIEVVFEWE